MTMSRLAPGYFVFMGFRFDSKSTPPSNHMGNARRSAGVAADRVQEHWGDDVFNVSHAGY